MKPATANNLDQEQIAYRAQLSQAVSQINEADALFKGDVQMDKATALLLTQLRESWWLMLPPNKTWWVGCPLSLCREKSLLGRTLL